MFRKLLIGIFSIIFIAGSFASNAQSTAVGNYASVNGLKLYYEIHGSGEPLVLLHGGIGGIEMFGPNLAVFAEKRRVIAVNLQGHGRTADIDRPLRCELMADDIAALIKHLKHEKVDVVGYSLGGGVALQTAIRHPDVVRKLVVASTTFKRDGWFPEVVAAFDQMGPANGDAIKLSPLAKLHPNVDWSKLFGKLGEMLRVDYDWSKEVAAIKAQTLLVFADADGIQPAHITEFYRLLGGGLRDPGWDGSGGRSASQLAIVPGATHYDLFTTDRIANLVMPFLDPPTINLAVTRVFDAAVERVWQAWVKPEYVKQWWGPQGFTCPIAEMDFREGGSSFISMRAPKEFGGQDYYSLWTYNTIVPNERIEFMFSFSDKGGNKKKPQELGQPEGIPDAVRHVVTFKNLGNGKTEMTVTEYGYTSPQVVEMSKMGLEQCLDKMAAIFVKQ